MRNFLYVAGGAVLALTLWSGADRALGFEVSVGGLAGQCSSNAKQGLHDPHALEICTLALDQPSLNAHDRAGTYVNRGAMEVLNRDWEEAARTSPRRCGSSLTWARPISAKGSI